MIEYTVKSKKFFLVEDEVICEIVLFASAVVPYVRSNKHVAIGESAIFATLEEANHYEIGKSFSWTTEDAENESNQT